MVFKRIHHQPSREQDTLTSKQSVAELRCSSVTRRCCFLFVVMFSSLLLDGRKTLSKFAVQAFTTTTSRPGGVARTIRLNRAWMPSSVITGDDKAIGGHVLVDSRHPIHHCHRQQTRFMVSSPSSVDEDLDAALDDILGEAFKEAENPIDMEPGNHIEGSRPIPRTLVEEEVIDYKDKTFLSTSNPRWVQAGLSQAVIDVLSSKGITHFTPVQGEAFDPIMARRDVIGRSRTGTGKTLAFGLPSLTRLVDMLEKTGKRDERGRMQRGRNPSMLVLCPTRELARQVQDELSQVARPLGLFTEVFHGGVSYSPQARALQQGIDIVVGTPGRIMDHLDRGNLDLSECDVVVLDEADEMLNMGFAEDVEVRFV